MLSPKYNDALDKVVDVEGERVTCREASIVEIATGEISAFPLGSVAVVARMYGHSVK